MNSDHVHNRSSSRERPTTPSDGGVPVDLKLNRDEQTLRICWRDGHESVFKGQLLRKNCPCATCRAERDAQAGQLLPILKHPPPSDVRIVNANLVGHYAIQLFWSDGHDTGIFDFQFLRGLDPGGRPVSP